jgi:hypothetical protein
MLTSPQILSWINSPESVLSLLDIQDTFSLDEETFETLQNLFLAFLNKELDQTSLTEELKKISVSDSNTLVSEFKEKMLYPIKDALLAEGIDIDPISPASSRPPAPSDLPVTTTPAVPPANAASQKYEPVKPSFREQEKQNPDGIRVVNYSEPRTEINPPREIPLPSIPSQPPLPTKEMSEENIIDLKDLPR